MAATLMLVFVTPSTPGSGTFFFSSTPDASVIGGAPGLVVTVPPTFADGEFEQATSATARTAQVATIRERIVSPGRAQAAED